MNTMESFFAALNESIEQDALIKLTLSKPRDKNAVDYKSVFIKTIDIKGVRQLSFVYRHPTNDVTKNFDPVAGLKHIRELAETTFVHSDLFTQSASWHVTVNKRGKATVKRKQQNQPAQQKSGHDRQKKRLIALENNVYLRELGIVTNDWKVKKNSEDKYRQINKFVEIVGGLVANSLTLLADAGHMFLDASALAFSWYAVRLSRRLEDERLSYGYHRWEVLAAFVNWLTLIALVGWILFEAWERLNSPQTMLPLPALD